ncbi:MAG: alpha/beta fold hydrolase [Rhodosalinus sp.]
MAPDAAPYFDDIAGGPDGSAVWVRADDGVRLRVGGWRADGDAGTVLLFPGRTEFIEKYGRTAAEFLREGLSVLAIDWRGQGLSDRLIEGPLTGHVHAFADYQRDVAAMVAAARALEFPEPFHLLGHSMGGAIGLRALMDGLGVRSAAFTAPMWGILMAPHLRPAAWALSWGSRRTRLGYRIAPGAVIECYAANAPFEDNTLTTCPDNFAYMQRQLIEHPELQLGGPSLIWLYEALVECRAIVRAEPPRHPCVTWLGTRERIVDPGPIRARMARWPGGRLEQVADAEHELLMEREAIRRRVIAGTVDHFRANGDAAA